MATVMRTRVVSYLQFAVLVWPVITIVNTALSIRSLAYYSPSWRASFLAALAGTVLSVSEMLVSAILAIVLATAIFASAQRRAWLHQSPTRRVFWGEAALVSLSVAWGAALWYPASLNQPLLGPVLSLPFGLVAGLVAMAIVAGSTFVARFETAGKLASVLLVVGALIPLPSWIARSASASATDTTLVLMGIDSIAVSDVPDSFRSWLDQRHAQTFNRVVTPALLTNAVWASVLSGQEPRQHGVWHTFQALPGERARLVQAAKANGYWTVSSFSNQLTSAVGADSGFDEDSSGPIGWRELVLPIVHDRSLLLPLVRPWLPRTRAFATPPNLAGSYSYSLRRDIRDMLASGRPDRRTFAAGHLTYLHLPTYPASADLGWSEYWRVLLSPARNIQDRSFDWMDVDDLVDAIPLHQWKRQALFDAVRNEIESSGFLARGGQLLMFSDHGERRGLTDETFISPQFHNVLLTTFNLPTRDVESPRSLVDISFLLGLTPEPYSGVPGVELAIFPTAMWGKLVATARLDWNGRVHLDERELAAVARGARRFQPWK